MFFGGAPSSRRGSLRTPTAATLQNGDRRLSMTDRCLTAYITAMVCPVLRRDMMVPACRPRVAARSQRVQLPCEPDHAMPSAETGNCGTSLPSSRRGSLAAFALQIGDRRLSMTER
eukprot:694254-Rhodomonas_salina.1